jgi:hypothetical protein
MQRRYACIRQTDQSDCGAAALAAVALHYHRPICLQQLRERAGIRLKFMTLLVLYQATETLHAVEMRCKPCIEALASRWSWSEVRLRPGRSRGHIPQASRRASILESA